MSDELIAGFDRLTGSYVSTLENKEFVVIKAENREVDDLDTQGKKKIKTVLTIELNGAQMEWFANKTSLGHIAKAQKGFMLSDMIGFKGEFVTVQQKVGKDMRDVIYVKGSV